MKKIDKYTVAELMNKYKDIVGEEIIQVIISSLMPNNGEIIKRFQTNMNNLVAETEGLIKNPILEKDYRQIKIKAIYRKLESLFNLDKEFNNDTLNKRAFLAEINRRFASKMSKEQKVELLDLIVGKNDYVIYEFNSEEYPGITDIDIITRTKSKKLSEISDIKKTVILKIALRKALEDESMKSMLKEDYEEDYSSIMKKVLVQFLVKDGRIPLEEYKKWNKDTDFKSVKVLHDKSMVEEFEKAILEFFEENFQFIDEENLLLNLAARTMLGIRLAKGEEIDGVKSNKENASQEDKEIAKRNSISILREIYEELKSTKYEDKGFGIFNDNGEIIIEANMQNIKELLSRCTKDDYLTYEDIERIHRELLEGNLTQNLEERKIANLDINDLLRMMETYHEKEENRDKILACAIELVEYLKTIGNVTNEQLIDLYLGEQLGLDFITSINMDDISEEYFIKTLKEMYIKIDFQEQEEKQKHLKELTRFTMLGKSLEERGIFEINRDRIVEEILDASREDKMNEVIADLHKIGVIGLEEAIEWSGKDTIIRRYKEGNLKPAEVRDCYNKQKITLDDLVDIIKMIPQNSERFMIIGGIFPGEEDIDLRDILISECMRLEEGLKKERKGVRGKKTENRESNYFNKYITDPFARLSLIQALDPEYSFEISEDGHAIITLPTLEKVIIEKMLDKDNLPSYGSATYLLDEDYYEKNYGEIMVKNKINRSKIIKDLGNTGADRIIHGVESWGKNIKSYFGIEEKSRWSDEDRKKIDDAIERIKRTCKIKEIK